MKTYQLQTMNLLIADTKHIPNKHKQKIKCLINKINKTVPSEVVKQFLQIKLKQNLKLKVDLKKTLKKLNKLIFCQNKFGNKNNLKNLKEEWVVNNR